MSVLSAASVMTFIATARPAEARAFYEDVLGLKFVEDSPLALVFELQSAILRIQKVDEVTATAYTALGWQVADIKTAVEELTTAGVIFERYENLPQDDLGIWATADGSAVAWFKDPDGNLLSLAQLGTPDIQLP